jgi:DNA-binding MarR family transcriptional regulator
VKGYIAHWVNLFSVVIKQVRSDPKLSTRGLTRLIEKVGKAAYNLGYTPGLNPAQWAAMRYFDETTIKRRTVTGFAQFQGTTKGTASQTVAALVRKEFLQRIGDKQDRRVHSLVLTDKGQALLKNDPLQELSQALGVLNQEDRWALALSLEKVLRQIIRLQASKIDVQSPAKVVVTAPKSSSFSKGL